MFVLSGIALLSIPPSFVTKNPPRAICSPRKLGCKWLPVTKSGCKGVQSLRTNIVILLKPLCSITRDYNLFQ